MPLYDYVCAACERRFEVIHGVHSDPPSSCPLCGGGPVRKAITAPAVHYKGSGWAKKERRAVVKTGATKGDADEGSSGAGSSETPASGSDDGPSKDQTPPKTDAGSSEAAPRVPATGETSKGTPRASKSSGTATTTPVSDRD